MDSFQGDEKKTIYIQIRFAKKKRKELRNNSFELRQQFLENLAEEEAALQKDNSKKEQILCSIKKTESQKRMYAIMQRYLKPEDR
eukprot:scaffold421241_cov56-Attheya_sp.AAC.2